MGSIHTSFILRLADMLLALHYAGPGCVGHADFMCSWLMERCMMAYSHAFHCALSVSQRVPSQISN